ncbi:uncharacterized protein Tco025E_02738 [Trypanosoma conorhini]|uniref:Present in the outer mitochondrial membrane proteome 13 n=1 Tax=Trypanosoma conorhini TaxID=83891 RepID=A0A422Q1D5_9TRYP|nr:uncharacterized protein Tco025E_02738 [Trypanosoma conorhini]RNF23778.1 hypothetical protein Tco025E_02738 [Trypanosoma conorhini]
MAALSNGGFIFIGAKRQLLLLEKGTHQEAQIVYGGEVAAFACREDESIVALAFPPSPGQDRCVVRLYTFAENELGEALGEVMNAQVTQLLWVGLKHLVLCGPAGCTIYVWNGEKLSFFVSDPATHSFLQGTRLGLFYGATQSVQYWNLDTNRMVDSVKLSLQGRRLLAAVGVGYFGFALHDDGSVQVFYVTKSNIKKIGLLSRLLTVSQEEDREKSGAASPLLACALSSRKVLVGLRGADTVHKLEYRNEKVVVDSMQEKLPSPHVLVAISRDGRRCLALNTETNRCHALVLSFSGSREATAEARDKNKSRVTSEKNGSNGAATLASVKEKRHVASSADEGPAVSPVKAREAAARRSKVDRSTEGTGAPKKGVASGVTLTAVGCAALALFVLARRVLSRQR